MTVLKAIHILHVKRAVRCCNVYFIYFLPTIVDKRLGKNEGENCSLAVNLFLLTYKMRVKKLKQSKSHFIGVKVTLF